MIRAKTAASRPPPAALDRRTLRRAADLLKQASNLSRLRTLLLLREQDCNVTQLTEELGPVTQPAVSHHLTLLRLGGLIEVRREGRHNFYGLTDKGRALCRAIAVVTGR